MATNAAKRGDGPPGSAAPGPGAGPGGEDRRGRPGDPRRATDWLDEDRAADSAGRGADRARGLRQARRDRSRVGELPQRHSRQDRANRARSGRGRRVTGRVTATTTNQRESSMPKIGQGVFHNEQLVARQTLRIDHCRSLCSPLESNASTPNRIGRSGRSPCMRIMVGIERTIRYENPESEDLADLRPR